MMIVRATARRQIKVHDQVFSVAPSELNLPESTLLYKLLCPISAFPENVDADGNILLLEQGVTPEAFSWIIKHLRGQEVTEETLQEPLFSQILFAFDYFAMELPRMLAMKQKVQSGLKKKKDFDHETRLNLVESVSNRILSLQWCSESQDQIAVEIYYITDRYGTELKIYVDGYSIIELGLGVERDNALKSKDNFLAFGKLFALVWGADQETAFEYLSKGLKLDLKIPKH